MAAFLPFPFPRGDEADRVRMLKDALGLSDEDAAPAHIDVARRLYRQVKNVTPHVWSAPHLLVPLVFPGIRDQGQAAAIRAAQGVLGVWSVRRGRYDQAGKI